MGSAASGCAADAGDGDRGAGSSPRHEQSRARAQDNPYQLRGLKIVEPNHVWAADVTYIPMACGFLYLVAIIDWASRGSGMAAVEHQRCELLHGGAGGGAASVRKAADFQCRSGLHFHRRGFHQQLVTAGVVISMDERGRFMDNIFI